MCGRLPRSSQGQLVVCDLKRYWFSKSQHFEMFCLRLNQAAMLLRRDQDREKLLVEVKPLTGRTHQIRVHLASEHTPILGDDAYGWQNMKPCLVGGILYDFVCLFRNKNVSFLIGGKQVLYLWFIYFMLHIEKTRGPQESRQIGFIFWDLFSSYPRNRRFPHVTRPMLHAYELSLRLGISFGFWAQEKVTPTILLFFFFQSSSRLFTRVPLWAFEAMFDGAS